MVEVITKKYLGSRRLLFMLSGLMAGGIISQTLGCLMGYLVIEDSQAAGMVAHLLIQQVSYYLLGCTFVILSLSNILIKRGLVELKDIRTPSLILILCVAFTSFLLIPRMDYLREVALQDGMPVMLSPFAIILLGASIALRQLDHNPVLFIIPVYLLLYIASLMGV